MSTRQGRIARNAAFNVGTGVASAGALLVTGIVVARFLGPDETGLYALVNWGVVVVVTLAATGVGFAAMKFVAQHHGEGADGDEVASIARFSVRAGIVGAVLAGAVFAAASGPLARAFGEPRARDLFLLGACVAVPLAITRVVAGPLQGLQRQALFLPLTLAQGLLFLAGSAAVLAAGGGLVELFYVQIAVASVVLVLHVAVLRRVPLGGTPRRLAPAMRSRILSYGAVATGLSALDLVVWQRSEVVLLGIFAEPRTVAFYSIAFALAEGLQQIVPTAVSTALFPSLSRAFATDDRAFMAIAYERSVRITVSVTLPVAVGGALLAAPAIETLYGEEFVGAAVALQILLFSAAAGRIGYSFSSLLFAGDRERLLLVMTVGWAVLNVGLGLAFIPAFGLVGAALVNAGVQILAVATGPVIVWRLFGLSLPFGSLLRVAAATLPMAGAIVIVTLVVDGALAVLLLGGLAGTVAYAATLPATGALAPDELALARERLGSVLRRGSARPTGVA